MNSASDIDKLNEQIKALSEYITERATKAAAYAAEQQAIQNGGNT